MGNCFRYQYDDGAAIETVFPGRRFLRMTKNFKYLAPSSLSPGGMSGISGYDHVSNSADDG